MNAGDTYQTQGSRHLWVIISDPQVDGENVLVANFTSNKRWQDQSCKLYPGEHSYITEETVIFYQEAKLHTNADLDAKLAAGTVKLHDEVSAEVLAKIREGARISTRIRLGYQQLLADQGLIVL